MLMSTTPVSSPTDELWKDKRTDKSEGRERARPGGVDEFAAIRLGCGEAAAI